MDEVTVIGGGLAGSEAAWQLAMRGVGVRLIEMRPLVKTPAHRSGLLAELVCSNSFRAAGLENAVGLLKEEMRLVGSLIMGCATATAVPAGGALAVDRDAFSRQVTSFLENHPRVILEHGEVTDLPRDGLVIVATGPLTSASFSQCLNRLFGSGQLYFYDAAAPIVAAESIAMENTFWGSRYGKGDGEDYLNCPLDKEEYETFIAALLAAEVHPLREFEKPVYFEGCMPIEVMASRGPDTPRYGPMKPVGLMDTRTGKEPYAVVQLRRENLEASLFNLVGFQTNLKWPEQKRVFGLIPALRDADYQRFGFIHRNTYINSPSHLTPTLQVQSEGRLIFAGQITGVEGYVESTACGLVAGINAARMFRGQEPLVFPAETMIGSLLRYITNADNTNFQPMKAAFGLLPALVNKARSKKRERNRELSRRSLETLQCFLKKSMD